MNDEFEVFWRAYPRRIAKGTARTAFAKAIKLTTLESMLEAIALYIEHKPEKIDFKHPSTWLNGECWHDEWQNQPKQYRPGVVGAAQRMIENANRSGDGDYKNVQRVSTIAKH